MLFEDEDVIFKIKITYFQIDKKNKYKGKPYLLSDFLSMTVISYFSWIFIFITYIV